MLSFYLTAQNIEYRLTHLLLVLPGITALRCSVPDRRLYKIGTLPTLGLLWSPAAFKALNLAQSDFGPVVPGAGLILIWLIREIMCWWLITIFIGRLTGLCLRSTIVRFLLWPHGVATGDQR